MRTCIVGIGLYETSLQADNRALGSSGGVRHPPPVCDGGVLKRKKPFGFLGVKKQRSKNPETGPREAHAAPLPPCEGWRRFHGLLPQLKVPCGYLKTGFRNTKASPNNRNQWIPAALPNFRSVSTTPSKPSNAARISRT